MSSGAHHSSVAARSASATSASSSASAPAVTCSGAEALDEPGEDLVVEFALAGERPIACAQHLVLEALELRGDEALGGSDRLTADVVLRHLLGVAARDLDEKSLHAVVAELEPGEPGALALAPLEIQEKLIRMGSDAAQLVELGVVTGRDHLTVAHQARRLGGDRGGEQAHRRPRAPESARGAPRGAASRWARASRAVAGSRIERAAQLRQVARPCRAQRHPREYALDVADSAQRIAQRTEAAAVDQRTERLVTWPQQLRGR